MVIYFAHAMLSIKFISSLFIKLNFNMSNSIVIDIDIMLFIMKTYKSRMYMLSTTPIKI